MRSSATFRFPLGLQPASFGGRRLFAVSLCCLPMVCPWRAGAQAAQTQLKLSTITPGTESVQLVYNGDFQMQGPLTSNNHPSPHGWTRPADMFAGPGTHLVQTDGGVAALAYLSNAAPVGTYSRTITLQPATDYVLSAYMWNMGDSANHVTTVIDMSDAPGEPQMTLSYGSANADQGYFVYRSFNTTTTGITVTLRVFYDGLAGPAPVVIYSPLAAKWKNFVIPRPASFPPPQAGGNL